MPSVAAVTTTPGTVAARRLFFAVESGLAIGSASAIVPSCRPGRRSRRRRWCRGRGGAGGSRCCCRGRRGCRRRCHGWARRHSWGVGGGGGGRRRRSRVCARLGRRRSGRNQDRLGSRTDSRRGSVGTGEFGTCETEELLEVCLLSAQVHLALVELLGLDGTCERWRVRARGTGEDEPRAEATGGKDAQQPFRHHRTAPSNGDAPGQASRQCWQSVCRTWGEPVPTRRGNCACFPRQPSAQRGGRAVPLPSSSPPPPH